MSQRSSSVYRTIANEIIEKIKDGTFQNGSLLPSESALAEQYSVQRTTIRRALKLLEGQYIYKRAGVGSVVGVPKDNSSVSDEKSRIGTEKQNSISYTDKSKKILFILPESEKAPSYIYDTVELIGNSFDISVIAADDLDAIKEFEDGDLLGVVLCSRVGENVISLLVRNKVPCVSLCYNNTQNCVMVDVSSILESVVDTFSKYNHTDICFIGNDDFSGSNIKISGLFTDIALKKGYDEKHTATKSGVYTSSQAMQVFFGMYRQTRDKFTAICTSSEEIAAGVIKAANEFGLKIPDDISVISISPVTEQTDICCPVICKEQFANQIIYSLLCQSEHPYINKTSSYLSGLSLSDAKTISESKKGSSVSRRSISDYLL